MSRRTIARWRRIGWAVAALMLVLMLVSGPSPAHACGADAIDLPTGDPWDASLAGLEQIGGATTAVAVSGSTIYAAVGARIVSYHVCDGLVPAAVGRTGILPEVPQDLAVQDWLLYVGLSATSGVGTGQFGIFDVTEPARPRLIGKLALHQAVHVGAITRWQHLALVVTDTGLTLIDVKNPYAPRELATVPTGTADQSAPGDVAVVGDVAFVGRPWGLFAADLHDPRDPRPIELPAEVARLAVDHLAVGGSMVLATDGRSSLRVLDVTQPTAPRLASHVAGLPQPTAVAAWERLAVVLMGGRALALLDLTDPTSPRMTTTIDLAPYGSTGGAMTIAGGQAFVALERSGLHVVDLRSAGTPVRVPEEGGESALPPLLHVSPVGRYAYGVAGPAGLYVLDLQDASNTVVTGQLDLVKEDVPGTSRAVDMRSTLYVDGMLYVQTAADGLLVIDVMDPAHPAMLGQLALPATSFNGDMALVDGYLYVPAGDRSLHVFDVRAPRTPRQVAVRDGMDIISLATDGRRLYALGVGPAAWTGFLQTLDIQDPARPRTGATYDFNGVFTHLAVRNRHVYMTGNSSDLVIIDVTDPQRPAPVARSRDLASGRVGIDERRLYAARRSELGTIFVGDPRFPLAIGGRPLPWGTDALAESDVVLAGTRLLASRGQAGLFILPVAQAPRFRTILLPSVAKNVAARPPACAPEPLRHVTLVLDTSEAMRQPLGRSTTIRLAAVQTAARAFLDRADLGALSVGLVRFDHQAELLASGSDRVALSRALDGLQPRAGARVDLGLFLAYEDALASLGQRDGRTWTVLLLAGPPDAPTASLAVARAGAMRQAGIQVQGVALGAGSEVAFLRQIAGQPERVRAAAEPDALVALLRALADEASRCAGMGCGCVGP